MDAATKSASSDTSSQETPKDLMAAVRKARQQRIEDGKLRGWVSDTLKGHCCECDTNLGFSRAGNCCRNCTHNFCNFCTSIEEVQDDLVGSSVRIKLGQDSE